MRRQQDAVCERGLLCHDIAGVGWGDADFRIGDGGDQGGAGGFDRFAGDDAAVDIGARALGQRILGMAGGDLGCDAGGAQHGIEDGIARQDAFGVGVLRVFGDCGHRLADGGREGAAGVGEEGLGGVVKCDRELLGFDGFYSGGEAVNRVVGAGHGTVAAGVGRLDDKVLIMFFANLQVEHLGRAIGADATATTFVHGEFGIDQRAPVFCEPLRAVEGSAGFFAAGEREFHGALEGGFGFQPDHGVGVYGSLRLVVCDAATKEEAIFLDQGEGVAGPVFPLCGDHIDMGKQEDGLQRGVCAGENGNEAAVFRVFGHGEQGELGWLVAGGLQPGGDLLCSLGAAANADGGVGFDELLVKAAEGGLAGISGESRGGDEGGC